MATYPLRYKLPVKFSTEIGRIITRYAFMELIVSDIVYLLLDLDSKRGRVAVRNPRITDLIVMIKDLMALQKFKTSVDLKQLSKECDKIKKFRDSLAHGVWVKHPDSKHPVIREVTGSYPNQSGDSQKARIHPIGKRITPKDFKNFLKGIDLASAQFVALHMELTQQIASRDKQRSEDTR